MYQSGKSKRFIAEYLGISRNTVNKYLDLVVLGGQSLEVLLQKSDQELNRIFESKVINKPEKLFELEKLFPLIDKELKRPGVTEQGLFFGDHRGSA